MQAGGPNYFIAVAIHTVQSPKGAGTFVLAVVWRQIEQVAAPRCSYQRPRFPPGAQVALSALPANFPAKPPPYTSPVLPENVRIPRTFLQKTVGWVLVAAVLSFLPGWCVTVKPLVVLMTLIGAVFGWWWAVLEYLRLAQQKQANAGWEEAYWSEQRAKARHEQELARWQCVVQQERVRRQQSFQSALKVLARAEHHWQQEAARYYKTFMEARMKLEGLKKNYESLSSEYRAEHQQLQKNVRTAQLEQFLQRKFISDAQIPDIGPVLKAALCSYGIEVAFDVKAEMVDQVPGFGPKRTKHLIAWRAEMERSFRFDSGAGIPQSQLDALNVKYKQRQQELEAFLSKGPESLKLHSLQAENHLSQLLAGIHKLVVQVAQAEADVRLLES
jgi:DNA-binding helix-hairpin-helix protein with protein kinase domain